MHESENVRLYYDADVGHEWARFERHPVEFAVTKRLLARLLPPPPARVLDAGGGPGRYALWLAGLGYDVTLFDLSPANVEFARRESARAERPVAAFVAGNALELSSLVGGRFDAVLLMGPLYHLTAETDRVRAVEESLAVLEPGGFFAATFISAYAPVLDGLKYAPGGAGAGLLRYLADGVNRSGSDNPGFTDAWFQHPSGVDGFMSRFPLEREGFYTVEAMLGPFEEALKKLEPAAFEACVDLAVRLAGDPNCRASGEHLLWAGRRK